MKIIINFGENQSIMVEYITPAEVSPPPPTVQEPDFVLVDLPVSFPVWAPPGMTVKRIWHIVRRVEPRIMRLHALIIHPDTLDPVKVGSNIAKTDPWDGLEKGIVV